MQLVRLFYVSEILAPISAVDVQVILGASQIRNRRLDVTGMLAQSDDHFAQVLEGRREAVDEVMARISRDSRHAAVRILLEESITRRQFAHWAMGLIRRDDLADELQHWHRDACTGGATAAHEMIRRLYPAQA
jgi:hypothetical protein